LEFLPWIAKCAAMGAEIRPCTLVMLAGSAQTEDASSVWFLRGKFHINENYLP